jgi:RNA polymerase sigma-70 factor (ECF subfamily)
VWLAGADDAPEARAASQLSTLDRELLAALKRSAPGAAAGLHDRARPIVDHTVARLLGRADMDRDDIAQLALIELITSIDRFRGDCSLDGWISMISARVVYKHIRRRKVERRIFGAPQAGDSGVVQRAHGGDALMRSALERVHVHLAALEPNKAWTFLLHDVCGYDLREIAQITGTSVAAAQTRLTRGRRELHERMAEDPELRGIADGGLP